MAAIVALASAAPPAAAVGLPDLGRAGGQGTVGSFGGSFSTSGAKERWRSGGEPLRLAQDPRGRRYVVGQLILTFEEHATPAEVRSLPARHGGDVEQRFGAIDARVVEFPRLRKKGSPRKRETALDRTLRRVESEPSVETAERDYVRETLAPANDPLLGFQWGLARIRAPQAWSATTGNGALISILDSGIDLGHPDIGGVEAAADFVNGDPVGEDNAAHGTHVAGIAAANTDNGRGIAGTAPRASLLNGKVCEFDPAEGTGICPLSAEIAGLLASADYGGVDVVNLSLGGPGCTQAERNAVEYAAARGIVLVAAAGNESSTAPTCPAAFPKVIAVAATDIDNGPSAFSNRGGWIDVAAPGGEVGNPEHEDILSTVPVALGGYAFYQGTSMASPFVAGVAGLLAAQGRSAAEIRRRIEATAVDLPPAGKDARFGQGLVNAQAAAGSSSPRRSGADCTTAKRKLASARQRVRRVKRQLRRADTRVERRAAKRRLADAKANRREARERKLATC